jgi:hypothetical protein
MQRPQIGRLRSQRRFAPTQATQAFRRDVENMIELDKTFSLPPR